MESYLFKQMTFVRSQTLKLLGRVTEETADRVPAGFRNTIRWQLGHIYYVMERLAFQPVGLPPQLPQGFKELFDNGTSPLNVPETVEVPTLQELEILLKDQVERVRASLEHRLTERVGSPYTIPAGLTLDTPEQFLGFNLFHEGMHLSVIKLYRTLLTK